MTAPPMKTLPLVAALAIALAAAAVHAAPPAGAQGTRAKIDANGDGVIDRSEAAAHPRLAERFDQLDKNRDGKIDASERPQRGQGGRQGGGMAKIDTNGDGMIDRSEAAAHPRLAERFDQLDKNRDGRIDASERPQRGQGGRQGDGRHGGGMAKLDANGDGAISLDEAAGHQRLLDKFEMIDTNADASLSRVELQAWRAQHGGRRGPGAQGGKP